MWRKDPLLVVILWWTALVAGVLVWLPLVRGATQGTYRWSLAAGIGGRGIGPTLFCGAVSAAIIWVVRDLRELAPWAWTRAARVRLLLLVALVPIEVVMFRSGGIRSIPNMIGVALIGWQWVLLNRVLAGARRPTGPEGIVAPDAG